LPIGHPRGARRPPRGPSRLTRALPEDPEDRAEVQQRTASKNQEQSRRHQVTRDLLNPLDVTAVVVVGASRDSTPELMLLEDLGRPTFLFSSDDLEPKVLSRLHAREPVREIALSREKRRRGQSDDSGPIAMPYPFVMQRLVASLINHDA
jgi:hypothetical protein